MIQCSDCRAFFEATLAECPICGSHNRTIALSENIFYAEQIKGKSKVKGIKKPAREFVCGDDYSISEQKYVDKTRIIDRANDHYLEEITDKKTGEIIHRCEEPLSEHYGHGTAKFKTEEIKHD